jgi:hypothetical protein
MDVTKIITKNKKNIVFNFLETDITDDFPKYFDHCDILTNSTTFVTTTSIGEYGMGYLGNLMPIGVTKSSNFSKSSKFYLQTIDFPNGHIDFNLLDRNDITGGKRLSTIQINSPTNLIKTVTFNYSYFDGSGVGGNLFTIYNGVDYGTSKNLRLKLLSLSDNSSGSHSFFYDETPLPSKNSLAQDFWGFYNGQLTNTSLVPNPSRLQVSQTGNSPGLSDNGNNNSALLNFCQASILKKVQYPTGGTVNFDYELNQFDNYIVPDFSNINNTISNGNGLRIKKITYQGKTNIDAKKTTYEYQGGKALAPRIMCRQFSRNNFLVLGNAVGNQSSHTTTNNFTQINGNGFYSSNSLGSGNGVGYSKVIKRDINANNIDLGKTETVFNNIPDDATNTSNNVGSPINSSLPVLKKYNTDLNGTIISTSIFDNSNRLLKKVENTFYTKISNIFYGARIFDYGNLVYNVNDCVSGAPVVLGSVPYTLVGYYPVFDKYTKVMKTTTTDFDNNNNPIVTYKNYSYGYLGLLNNESISKSKGSNVIASSKKSYAYAYDNYPSSPSSVALVQQNRFAEVTNTFSTIINGLTTAQSSPTFTDYDKVDHEYITLGDKIVRSKTTINNHPGTQQLPSIITYNLYDPTNANLLEYTVKNITNSMLWNYNSEYLSAEVTNATNTNIAATSFEADSKGNWTFSGLPITDVTAPTGKKIYTLNGTNNITKSGLTASKTYIVSYWLKPSNTTSTPATVNQSQALSITGTIANYPLIGRYNNGWKYFEHKITGQTAITISGAVNIDELRLYPVKALMSTYTYDPLIGMTSQCDANNKISYYVYDISNRLTIIKDQDNNILKKICYNYSGQVEDCPLNNSTASVWRPTGETRCQPCPSNANYNSGLKERQEKDINPNSATPNALRWVVDYTGTCTSAADYQPSTSTCQQLNGANTGNLVTTTVDANPCSLTYGQPGASLITPSNGSCISCSPACNEPQYKCINGVCVQGVWKVIKVVRVGRNSWECTRAWCYSGGIVGSVFGTVDQANSYSTYQVVTTGTTPCSVECF